MTVPAPRPAYALPTVQWPFLFLVPVVTVLPLNGQYRLEGGVGPASVSCVTVLFGLPIAGAQVPPLLVPLAIASCRSLCMILVFPGVRARTV